MTSEFNLKASMWEMSVTLLLGLKSTGVDRSQKSLSKSLKRKAQTDKLFFD